MYVTVPFLLSFFVYLRAVSKYKPPEACIRRGDLTEGFLRYEIEGAYLSRSLVERFELF